MYIYIYIYCVIDNRVDATLAYLMCDIKLNLMTRLQFRKSGECGVPVYWNYYQVNSDLLLVSVNLKSMGQMDLFKNRSYLIGVSEKKF